MYCRFLGEGVEASKVIQMTGESQTGSAADKGVPGKPSNMPKRKQTADFDLA